MSGPFTLLGPTATFALGLAVMAAILGFVLILLWRRLTEARAECTALRAEAETAIEIVAAVPDGFLLHDTASGNIRCSRRLAVLLELPEGTESGYEDVLARFDTDAAEMLRHHAETLYQKGRGFGLRLPVTGTDRLIQIIGIRAIRPDGEPAADILWFRDLTAAPPSQTPPIANEDLCTLLDALPFPVWIRGRERNPFYTNPAGRDETREDLNITEVPLGNGQMSAGFALPPEGIAAAGAVQQTDWFRILETVPTAMAVCDADARLRFTNAAFAALWRLDTDWLATNPRLGDLLDRLREARRLPEVADYGAFRKEQVAEVRTLTAPARSLMHLPDGTTLRRVVAPNPGGGLVFAYEDLSERLSLERSINELGAVQRETLDNMFEGVAVFGSDGRLQLSNPALTKLWELESEPDSEALHVTAFAAQVATFLPENGGAGGGNIFSATRLMNRQVGTGRLIREDGRIVEFATIPLPDGALMVSFQDVTDSARVEQALRQRAEALDAANRLKSEFIANVSHEIRTPLTTLIGFAEILTDGYFGKLNRRQSEYADGILDSSRNLMSVVSDILDLASIEAGMMALELDIVDVHGLLAGLLKLVRERTRVKSLAIEFDCPSNIGWIVADERRLKQVFFNLMSNAVRFTPHGGRIGMLVYREGRDVVVSISDSGPGIDVDSLDRLTEPFERGTTPEATEHGAGLGLSLVTRFVELHNGTVEFLSAPGRGTTVNCRLPSGDAGSESLAPPDGSMQDPASPDEDGLNLESGASKG